MEPDQRRVFEKIFLPESVAIVGISRAYTGLGGQFFLKNLQRAEFPGRIYLINPTAGEINGMRAFPSISALPEAVDLAIVCVPAQFVPSVLEECSRKGVHNIHILSSGFKELGTPGGSQLEEELRRVALRGGLNIVGPNCMGPYVPKSRLMLWGQIPAKSGSLAFLSQSGTLTQRMSEHAHFMGMGISKAVSFGNAAVLDSTDYIDYLADDADTKVIGLYLESVRDGQRFLNLARRINQTKPSGPLERRGNTLRRRGGRLSYGHPFRRGSNLGERPQAGGDNPGTVPGRDRGYGPGLLNPASTQRPAVVYPRAEGEETAFIMPTSVSAWACRFLP